MTPRLYCPVVSLSLVAVLFLPACSTPTLVQIARRRQATDKDRKASRNVKDDVRIKYSVTDWDVLNFTDEVKRKLANRSSFHMGVRYGSSSAQATLGALAGAAKTFGWAAGTASGYGLGATYIFGMGQIFDSKSHAQAYEQAHTAIQSAEATYYFHQLGMGFTQVDGRKIVDLSLAHSRNDIPSQTNLTTDGETLYYRVTKILKVLNDTLATKIPDLQDLKEAHGESSAQGAPQKNTDAPPANTPSGTSSSPATASHANTTNRPDESVTSTRNARLENAFKALTDTEAKKVLGDQGETAPEGTPPKEYLAEMICSRANLPKRSNQNWIQSLTYYRTQANDEIKVTALEKAYRKYSLLPPL